MAQTSETQTEATPTAAKKAYIAPELHDHGHVRDVTMTSPNFLNGGNDGGTFPNIYAS